MNRRNLFYTVKNGKPVKRITKASRVKAKHGFALLATLDCGHVLRVTASKHDVGSRVCCEECKP